MRKGWQTKRLGDVCEIVKGRKPTLKTTSSKGDLPYLVAKVMRGSKEAEYASVNDRNSITVEESDTIIICDGSNSGEVFTGFRGILSSTMGKIAKKAEIDDDYLRAFLASTFDVFNGAKTGAAIPHLDKEAMYQLQFPFPPLSEQHRIVRILDEAFENIAIAKANAEKNLENAKAIFESYLNEVFTKKGEGWVENKVSEIAEHSLGKMLDKAKNKGEPQHYLRNVNVRWFKFDLSDLLQMPFLPSEAERYTAVKGDVLICEGGYPGRAAIWDADDPIYFQKALHRVRFYQSEHSKWFVYYLSAQDSNGQLKKHFSGTGIQHFTGEALARFTIPVPPLPELRSAVAKFDALSEGVQRLGVIYERKLAALEALKKSLLHQAFSGEL